MRPACRPHRTRTHPQTTCASTPAVSHSGRHSPSSARQLIRHGGVTMAADATCPPSCGPCSVVSGHQLPRNHASEEHPPSPGAGGTQMGPHPHSCGKGATRKLLETLRYVHKQHTEDANCSVRTCAHSRTPHSQLNRPEGPASPDATHFLTELSPLPRSVPEPSAPPKGPSAGSPSSFSHRHAEGLILCHRCPGRSFLWERVSTFPTLFGFICSYCCLLAGQPSCPTPGHPSPPVPGPWCVTSRGRDSCAARPALWGRGLASILRARPRGKGANFQAWKWLSSILTSDTSTDNFKINTFPTVGEGAGQPPSWWCCREPGAFPRTCRAPWSPARSQQRR